MQLFWIILQKKCYDKSFHPSNFNGIIGDLCWLWRQIQRSTIWSLKISKYLIVFHSDSHEYKVGKPYIFLNIISSAIQWHSCEIHTGMGVCAIFRQSWGWAITWDWALGREISVVPLLNQRTAIIRSRGKAIGVNKSFTHLTCIL